MTGWSSFDGAVAGGMSALYITTVQAYASTDSAAGTSGFTVTTQTQGVTPIAGLATKTLLKAIDIAVNDTAAP